MKVAAYVVRPGFIHNPMNLSKWEKFVLVESCKAKHHCHSTARIAARHLESIYGVEFTVKEIRVNP